MSCLSLKYRRPSINQTKTPARHLLTFSIVGAATKNLQIFKLCNNSNNSNKNQEARPLMKTTLKKEWLLPLVWIVAIVFKVNSYTLFGDLENTLVLGAIFSFLFFAIMLTAFAVVRHADELAEILGEPLGTLILTMSVIIIEVSIISAVMLTGTDSPTMARDTMYSVIMIIMNGLVGFALLIGGLKHKEQIYNLQGTNTFLAIILPLSVIGLILPTYTHATNTPTFSLGQSIVVGVSTIGLYLVFLAVQTIKHRGYFDHPGAGASPVAGANAPEQLAHHEQTEHKSSKGLLYHGVLLLAYLVPVVLLAKSIAIPVEHGIATLGLPVALGGFVIAALVLSPEALGAMQSAMKNQLQRSINIFLGSVAATIGLTVPAVLAISVLTGEPLILGLDSEQALLLGLTLAVSMITYTSGRTNILLGAVHLVLFSTYLMLIFDTTP
jgi:Ca2+:H+ antiporter